MVLCTNASRELVVPDSVVVAAVVVVAAETRLLLHLRYDRVPAKRDERPTD
jgi:hypothetical protein